MARLAFGTLGSVVMPAMMLVLAGACGVARGQGDVVSWRADYEGAVTEARLTGRPLWIQFTGPWCIYCRRIERETFARGDVAALARDWFVAVRVDSEQREDLVRRFQVLSLPTTIVLVRDQQVRLRHEGYASPEQFLGLMMASRGSPPASEVALGGADAVELVLSGEVSAGDPAIRASFAGMEFRFRSESAREEFLRSPERYTPCGGGQCLVHLAQSGQSALGDARYGVYYRERLYLCADEASRQQFAKDPERYAQADIAAQGLCVHCSGADGSKQRGLPQFTFFYRGLRYLFPDEEHRQAFRSDPEKYLR